MPTIQITQKFPPPSMDEGKFLATLERFSQNVATALNTTVGFNYIASEQPTGSNFVLNGKNFAVYSQTKSFIIPTLSASSYLTLQAVPRVIFVLSVTGVLASPSLNNFVPLGFCDLTNYFSCTIGSDGQILASISPSYVGYTAYLTVQYTYQG